jgi:hypothetical protein
MKLLTTCEIFPETFFITISSVIGQWYLSIRVLIRIWIGSGFNQVSGSGSGFGIRIRIQEAKMTQKIRKQF